MSIDRPNLASAFAAKQPIDRAAGLTGLLPAPRPRPSTSPSTSTSATAATTPDVEPDDQAEASDADTSQLRTAPTAQKPGKTVRTLHAETPTDTTATPVSATADTVTNVAVYLEPDLLEQVRATRRATGTTYDQLVVTAFEQLDTDTLRAQFQPAGAATSASGMPLRRRRPRGTAGIQIQLRLTGPQRTWLQQQQEQLGAPSRSALIAAALRQHLTR